MAVKATQLYNWDWVYVEKSSREITLTSEVKTKIDKIPTVVDGFWSDDPNAALSAAAGKLLKEQVDNVSSMWKYLSAWDCTTGLPQTDPLDNPHQYKVWDYYVIAKVGETNYRPNNRQYEWWVASTVVEQGNPAINDSYYYDGYTWVLQPSGWRVITIDSSMSSTSDNPVQNKVITQALNVKADKTEIPTRLWQLTNDKDYQTGAQVQETIHEATSGIPTNVSQLINDVQYQTLQQVNWIVNTATADVIKKWDSLSELNNDVGFQTAEDVQQAITVITEGWLKSWDNVSELVNDAKYQTESQVNSKLSTATMNFMPKNGDISQLNNDANYITSWDIKTLNGTSLVGSWNVTTKTINGESLLWTWDIKVSSENENVFLTQWEYDRTPATKETDWKTYIVYEEIYE